MNDEQFDQLIKKLDILTKLISVNLIQGKKLSEQVRLLYSAGIPISEVAEILGTKTDNISQYVYRKKK